jgi:phage terminase large subunit-like protein
MQNSPSTRLVLPDSTVKLLHEIPIQNLTRAWLDIEEAHGNTDQIMAALGRVDRFYLLVNLLHREDAFHPWLYERCREVEADTDGHLDLWFREGYKSTIITFAGIIQEVVDDPDITIGIFSHTKHTSRAFLAQIKTEFEGNTDLIRVYPDVLYDNPKKDSPKWSVDGGIVVKRQSNPKESTVEGHGLVDGMPTGMHFRLLVYDDVVTLESIGTPDQVKKTTAAWELSDNLGARDPNTGLIRKWHIGTRYSFADTYEDIKNKGVLKLRIHPATDNGLPDGNPVFLSPEAWAAKKATMSRSILAAQMLQNPAAGNEAMFQKDWLKFADIRPSTLNVYILGDPAGSKKKDSDNTAFAVIGIDANRNKYLLDGARHKMQLKERWECLYGLVKVWRAMPGVQMLRVGYEKYGMQSDIEYFEERMEVLKDAFEIVEVNWPKEGPGSKEDRVERLQPDFKAGKFFLSMVCLDKDKKPYETTNQRRVREAGQPYRIFNPVKRRDHEGNIYALNAGFLEEYLTFPFSAKKDLIDATSRVYDMDPVPPVIVDQTTLEPETFVDGI